MDIIELMRSIVQKAVIILDITEVRGVKEVIKEVIMECPNKLYVHDQAGGIGGSTENLLTSETFLKNE
ncbi:hypothetical protein GN156_23120, partial [bacterium LRH843]|nr:hypothetical protein [bacterium LRH843]